MHSEVAISAENLGKTYRVFGHPGDRIKQALTFGRIRFHDEFKALSEVSFDIKRGETIGIIGRNGSGKSTLLQLICGILKPSSGRVQVNGRISALLELGAGFNPEFTGRENVYFQGAVTGFTKADMDARFDRIASFADIGEFIDQPVRTYSSGMYVRLAFSVAIHVEPDILIVDEALGVGDALFTQKCFRFLNDFRKKGTLIVVSHDMRAVNGLCERALWLDRGVVQAFGPVKAVCENYLSALFGGAQHSERTSPEDSIADWADQRLPYLQASNLRNDLKLFRFDPAAPSFGGSGARIRDVRLIDQSGRPYSWVVGGEIVTLSIRAHVIENLISPIIGFTVKDGIGQALFGDNTYLSYADHPVAASPGETLEARFCFRMPRLPIGQYSIAAAIAEGSQGIHEFQHWVHDALVFESRRGSVDGALIGLPMRDISLTTTLNQRNTEQA
ncbi:ABC transporter ATP-binding protein [Polaromonas sp. CT11-55]|uniref:ABC transporter ATP-binding protein n=1 Tax=Polaromonas sp. CT11-55 TaxID=3243045 RepID=UPI0039A6F6E6